MAGSYQHLTDERDNIARDPATGGIDFGMIENLGDAKECIEELVGMVWFLTSGDKDLILRAQGRYPEGLEMAGVERQW